MASAAWLLCSYRVPRTPSRLRLAVWRRLRRLGAVMLQDGLWVLPAGPDTREDFEWLSQEIQERGGAASLWEAKSLDPGTDADLASRFAEAAGERVKDVLAEARRLEKSAARKRITDREREVVLQKLRTLDRGFRTENRRAWFGAPGAGQARQAIARALEAATTRRPHAVGHKATLSR